MSCLPDSIVLLSIIAGIRLYTNFQVTKLLRGYVPAGSCHVSNLCTCMPWSPVASSERLLMRLFMPFWWYLLAAGVILCVPVCAVCPGAETPLALQADVATTYSSYAVQDTHVCVASAYCPGVQQQNLSMTTSLAAVLYHLQCSGSQQCSSSTATPILPVLLECRPPGGRRQQAPGFCCPAIQSSSQCCSCWATRTQCCTCSPACGLGEIPSGLCALLACRCCCLSCTPLWLLPG